MGAVVVMGGGSAYCGKSDLIRLITARRRVEGRFHNNEIKNNKNQYPLVFYV